MGIIYLSPSPNSKGGSFLEFPMVEAVTEMSFTGQKALWHAEEAILLKEDGLSRAYGEGRSERGR
jgi:hypothetical protein